MHGIIMIFLFLIPSIPSVLGNFLVPIMIGARDLAFPRLNLLSWYLLVLGGVVTLWAIVAALGVHGRVRVDADLTREPEMTILSTGIRRRWYGVWWQWYAIRREWNLRLRREMSFRRLVKNLHRLRLRHLKDLFGSLRRSARMVSEKSTNPYE